MKKFKRAVAVFLALAVCLCLSFGTFGGNAGQAAIAVMRMREHVHMSGKNT